VILWTVLCVDGDTVDGVVWRDGDTVDGVVGDTVDGVVCCW